MNESIRFNLNVCIACSYNATLACAYLHTWCETQQCLLNLFQTLGTSDTSRGQLLSQQKGESIIFKLVEADIVQLIECITFKQSRLTTWLLVLELMDCEKSLLLSRTLVNTGMSTPLSLSLSLKLPYI